MSLKRRLTKLEDTLTPADHPPSADDFAACHKMLVNDPALQAVTVGGVIMTRRDIAYVEYLMQRAAESGEKLAFLNWEHEQRIRTGKNFYLWELDDGDPAEPSAEYVKAFWQEREKGWKK